MKHKIRVFHVITGLSTGGAERALYNVLTGFSGKLDSAVISLTDEGTYGQRIRQLGVPVYTLGMRAGLPSLSALLKLRSLIRQLQPDVIQGWMYHGNLAAWLARRFAPGRPALAWNIRHSLYSLEAEKKLTQKVIKGNRRLSGSVDALLYNSRLSRQQHENFGFCADIGRVIPNGFDLDIWKPRPEPEKRVIRGREKIPGQALVIGHVARFHPMKDHAAFVRAAVRVVESCSDVHIVLVGRDVNRNNTSLVQLVPQALQHRFHWLGERHDIPALMPMLDVFCQSSWSEAFPNVLGEAMACGVPCVATDVGDSALVVGDTGVVVPPRNDAELYSALMDMVNRGPEARASLGQAARRRIETEFSLDAVVNQYMNLYRQLAAEKDNF
jgi:glycosyltransferase involved in cell wall biosynthesis